MPRAVIVAAGNLDSLPGEVQTVSNTLSAAGWTVRLCLGGDASRSGLMAAAGEGDVDLAWFGLHSGPDGFALSDGVWPPAQLGTWLRNVNACDVVLNSCYSIEHISAIQRAADGVGVACTINPAGVDDALAWQVGVHLVRAYVATSDMRAAVARASGQGVLQYRYVPAGGLVVGEGRRRMPAERIEEQLALLLRALYGEERNNVPGQQRPPEKEVKKTIRHRHERRCSVNNLNVHDFTANSLSQYHLLEFLQCHGRQVDQQKQAGQRKQEP